MEPLNALDGRLAAVWYPFADDEPGPGITDVVGVLSVGWDAVTVMTAASGPLTLPRTDVVAARAIPGPGARAEVDRLDGLCADAWPAPVERALGAWRLRSAGGWSRRASSALAVGDPGVPVARALDEVRAFAAEHGTAPRVRVATGSPADDAVSGLGWVPDTGHERGPGVSVLVAPLAPLADDWGPDVTVRDRPDGGWWRPGRPGALRPPAPSRAARRVLDPGPALRVGFVAVLDLHGTPEPTTGRLRAAVVDDHLHLSCLAGAVDDRDMTALIATAAHWGRGHGAEWAVAQCAADGLAGFVEHHRCRYLVPPP
jgi:hypothetical protein